MKYTSILLLGPPGAGKGTQGKMLAAIPGFRHSSSGEIFRQLDQHSEMGRTFLQHAGRGELVPDEFTVKLWKQYMKGLELTFRFRPEADILILDGIPRNVSQARLLDDTIDVKRVIFLEPRDMKSMIDRLKRRATKENRPDDADESIIRHRLNVYEQDTSPLLHHYPAELISRVDATRTPIEVFGEILKIVTPIRLEVDQIQNS